MTKKQDDTVLICRLLTHPLIIADNKVGACPECGRKIQFRPHAPKKARKICEECVRLEIERAKAEGQEVTVKTTKKIVDDFIAYIRRQQH